MPAIDLHTHTYYSDGTLGPVELLQLSKERGLDVVALTDHDTTSGLPEARVAADAAGIELVPGVEFSTEELIGDGGRAYVEKHALDPLDALALIKKAGGVCVIAHPAMWRGQDSVPDELIEKMAAAGMAGIEVDHPDQTPEQREHYRQL